MPSLDTVLPAAALVVALAVLVSVRRLRAELRADRGVDTDRLSAAMSRTWRDLDLDRTVGQLETHAERLSEAHTDIERMLRNPRERGEFGEQQLDVILGDHLPPEMYGLREQVVDGKTPDAHVRSASGLICIDAKFPLDNYEAYARAEDEAVRAEHRRKFAADVERQLEKIATDYVRPEAGTAEFAFAFIPSESVYYHLVSEEYDLLREYTRRGVQVVSPLTVGHKLELIKADVRAQQLSEEAEEIRAHLEELSARFETLEDDWSTLHRHVSNAKAKADAVDDDYGRLRAAFDRVEEPTLGEE